jgi:hypothetical protein
MNNAYLQNVQLTRQATTEKGKSMKPIEKPKLRGFAWLKANNPDRLKEICSNGGKEAHIQGTAHQYTSFTGKAAAIKMQITKAKRKAERATL